jgi:uncharacterized protein (TIGR00290 family)
MNARPQAWLSWSSGKDSAWSLEVMRRAGLFEVVALLTTVNRKYERVAMHAVRETLLRAQAESAGLPLVTVPIPYPCPNAVYEAAMAGAIERAKAAGVGHVAFGDLFLEDIRRYREEKMSACGMTPVFPVWGLDTAALAREMISSGVRAVITCVDPKKLPASFAGREFNLELLADLPAGVDPCGENGEFHSFVYAGPMFHKPILIETGQVVERDGFIFADVLPARGQASAAQP